MDDLISRQDVINAVLGSNFSACTVYGRSEEGMATAKELIQTIKNLPSAHCDNCPYPDEYVKEKEDALRWIPVSERMPELNDDGASDPVLLCWADRQIVVGFYAGDETFYAQSFPFAADGTARITAWMPLPDPYKEEK